MRKRVTKGFLVPRGTMRVLWVSFLSVFIVSFLLQFCAEKCSIPPYGPGGLVKSPLDMAEIALGTGLFATFVIFVDVILKGVYKYSEKVLLFNDLKAERENGRQNTEKIKKLKNQIYSIDRKRRMVFSVFLPDV